MKHLIRNLLVAFFCLQSSLVYAHIDALDMLNNQVNLKFVLRYLDYEERQHGDLLDEVYGFAPGAQIDFRKEFHHVIIEPSLEFIKNGFDYKGGVNFGPTGAKVHDVTDNVFVTARSKLGYLYYLDKNHRLMPYLAYGYRHWNRNVPPIGELTTAQGVKTGIGVNSYTEEYHHHFWMIGLELQGKFTERWTYKAFGSWGRTFKAHIEGIILHPLQVGRTYQLNLGLGSSHIYELALETQYNYTDAIAFKLGVDYLQFKYKKSKANALGVLEPDSRTWELNVRTGVSFALV